MDYGFILRYLEIILRKPLKDLKNSFSFFALFLEFIKKN